MARNKYPEETVKLILDVSTRLFIEKGYDNTSIQDIIDNLGGLSKGAIYYHFKSKEAILNAIGEEIGNYNERMISKIRDDKSMNGLEKLREIYRASLEITEEDLVLMAAPHVTSNPRFLAMQIQEIYDNIAPDYIRPILEEGIRDGSIKTEYPEQAAEAIMILTNIWMNPVAWAVEDEVARAKCQVFKRMLQGLGMDFVDDEMENAFARYCALGRRIKKK